MTRDQRRRWLVFVVLVGVPLALSTYVLPLRDDMVSIVAVATVGLPGARGRRDVSAARRAVESRFMRHRPFAAAHARLLALCAGCAAAFVLLVVVANNVYEESPGPQYPRGQHVLFQRVVPEPLGWLMWVGLKPMLLATAAASAWLAYRCARAWRAGPPAGLCARCGYDLRGTPHRCPECGTVPKTIAKRG